MTARRRIAPRTQAEPATGPAGCALSPTQRQSLDDDPCVFKSPCRPRGGARSSNLHRIGPGEKGLDLDLRVAPRLPLRVAGDPIRCRQALVTLASNAIELTERGRASVDLRVEPRIGRLRGGPLRGLRHRHRNRASSAPARAVRVHPSEFPIRESVRGQTRPERPEVSLPPALPFGPRPASSTREIAPGRLSRVDPASHGAYIYLSGWTD
jgi:hypothetical protein